jgi:hypothetical protein
VHDTVEVNEPPIVPATGGVHDEKEVDQTVDVGWEKHVETNVAVVPTCTGFVALEKIQHVCARAISGTATASRHPMSVRPP